MSYGRMNTLISIAREVVTKDAEGFATKTDQELASVFAYREGRHGSQKWVNRAAFSEATDLFRLRVIPSLTVTTAHVILCGDDRFEITSVEDVKGRGMYIEVLAKKVTSDG
ncbi:MAG: head-tail adaptor protein [Firmicutes bacterium HGW-Firmicutes-9]|jgi:head-tail adaptor|nr:MAG: head-tail adaptor protein [Firmicutes bacterium HGW-Firmicutes-9]